MDRPFVCAIGNAGNILGRLPVFRQLLLPPTTRLLPGLTLFALSPRGYWSSGGPLPFPLTPFTPLSNRLHQSGIVSDYSRGLNYLASRPDLAGLPIWILGHSLGGAAAVQILRRLKSPFLGRSLIAGLILENPLPSIRLMLKAIYPSKWLPYHHLGPFVRDEWDTIQAFRDIKTHQTSSALAKVPLLIIQSENDELVPPPLTQVTYQVAVEAYNSTPKPSYPPPQYSVIPYALHENAFLKPRYALDIHQFIERFYASKKK